MPMSKSHKKRTKPYRGDDAVTPVAKVVHRYTAEVRSPLNEWWHANKKRLRFGGIIVLVVALLTWLVVAAIESLARH